MLGERAPHARVHRLQLGPGRRYLHRVREGAQAKGGRLPKAHGVAMSKPGARAPLTQRTRRGARADLLGAGCVLVGLIGFTLEDQEQGRATEQVTLQGFNRALQPTRARERLAGGAAKPARATGAAIFW